MPLHAVHISAADADAARYEMFHHPDPIVQKGMMCIRMKSFGLMHEEIADVIGGLDNLEHIDPLNAKNGAGLRTYDFKYKKRKTKAGEPKPMRQIKQLIILHQQKNSIKAIARTLKISKNKVKEYLNKLRQMEVPLDSLLLLEDHKLEKKLLVGNPAYTSAPHLWIRDNLQYFIRN